MYRTLSCLTARHDTDTDLLYTGIIIIIIYKITEYM